MPRTTTPADTSPRHDTALEPIEIIEQRLAALFTNPSQRALARGWAYAIAGQPLPHHKPPEQSRVAM